MHDYDPFCCCAACCEHEAALTARISAEEHARREKRHAYAPLLERELQLVQLPLQGGLSRCR